MSFRIVPPYLLSAIASSGAPHLAHAAEAARRTLTIDQPYRTRRTRLELSVEPGGTLVASTAPSPDRTISDAGGREDLPGRTVRREDDPPTRDASADQAFDGLGTTFEFYWDAYGRDSIDGRGLALDATVHYGQKYDNAFWNGERMVFGDGDGDVFTGFTGSITVIAHELTHGVTESSGGLDYNGQPGALNESISDVFGALTEQYALNQRADQASWLIGAGIFAPSVHGVALRSMKAPGTAYDDPVLGSAGAAPPAPSGRICSRASATPRRRGDAPSARRRSTSWMPSPIRRRARPPPRRRSIAASPIRRSAACPRAGRRCSGTPRSSR